MNSRFVEGGDNLHKYSFLIALCVLTSLLAIVCFSWIYKRNSLVPEIMTTQVIDYEDAAIQSEAVHSNDQQFPIQASHSSDHIWLESSVAHEGSYSLGFRLEGDENREETRIIDIPNRTTKVIGFSVYFDDSFQIPTSWTVFAQWWQGAPASPPIAFEIIPNAKEFQFRILTRAGPYEHNRTTHQYNESIERGKWHNFIVEMRMDDTGHANGLLNVWMNGEQILNYEGALGYPNLDHQTNFRFGLYRDPDNQTPAVMYFDSIQIGNRMR